MTAIETIVALHAGGSSVKQIARQLGWPCDFVRDALIYGRARESCLCCGILLAESGDVCHDLRRRVRRAQRQRGLCWDCASRWVRDGNAWAPRDGYVLDPEKVAVGCDVRFTVTPAMLEVDL